MSWGLDLTEVKESVFEALPPGEYILQAIESVIKETKSGTGEYINVKFEVVDGDQKGRTLFHMFNIKNENQKAVEIGLGQLKTFMRCAGKNTFNLTSVNDLLGLAAVGVVKKRTDEYGEKSVVSYFKPLTDGLKTETKTTKSPFA